MDVSVLLPTAYPCPVPVALVIVEATVIHDSPPDLLLQFSGGFAISRKDDEIIPLEKEDLYPIFNSYYLKLISNPLGSLRIYQYPVQRS